MFNNDAAGDKMEVKDVRSSITSAEYNRAMTKIKSSLTQGIVVKIFEATYTLCYTHSTNKKFTCLL